MQRPAMMPSTPPSYLPPDISGETSAELFRWNAAEPTDTDSAIHEKVASGKLAKVVRIALSDPDDELWRYRILVGGEVYNGHEISIVATEIDLSLDPATAGWLASALDSWSRVEDDSSETANPSGSRGSGKPKRR